MTEPAMPADTFWGIIDSNAKSNNNPTARLEALHSTLSKLTLDELISFEVAFRHFLNEAYTWDLCGAAAVIHGSCSDDSFEYFRRWLVSRGRDVYSAAVADPDSLAQLDSVATGADGVWEFEEFYYVAVKVYVQKGGSGDIREHSEPEAGMGGLGPSGEPLPDDRKLMAKRYPKLWERFENKPLG